MSEAPQSASLYFTEGSSDKEYHAQLVAAEDGSGWLVNSQNGRRGKALRSRTKTPSPIPYAKALKAYEALVAEKLAKGYTPDVSGAVFQDTVAGENFTGLLPMLPQTVRSEAAIEKLMADSNVAVQEKFDGENRQVQVVDSVVTGINKLGMAVALPRPIADAVRDLGVDLLLSAEEMGGVLYVFDIQEWDGKDLREKPYDQRLGVLDFVRTALASRGESSVMVIPTATSAKDKRALVDEVRERSGEGVVFKDVNAPFVSGKLSATQSSTFKWKFTEDCTVRVSKISKTKRSVSVETEHEGQPVPLGSVSIPSNHDIPKVGDLVSVTYLHLYEGGSLFQGQYRGVRTDCEGPDSLDMFKVKAKEPVPTRNIGPR